MAEDKRRGLLVYIMLIIIVLVLSMYNHFSSACQAVHSSFSDFVASRFSCLMRVDESFIIVGPRSRDTKGHAIESSVRDVARTEDSST